MKGGSGAAAAAAIIINAYSRQDDSKMSPVMRLHIIIMEEGGRGEEIDPTTYTHTRRE